eukprot:g14694.t1
MGPHIINTSGENRYLSEPALYPTEFLIVLRLLQMLKLFQDQNAASTESEKLPGHRMCDFQRDLLEALEQLTGFKPSHVFFAQQQEDLHVLEDDELVTLPWRTGRTD